MYNIDKWDLEIISLAGDTLDRSPKKNWVENAGGLPAYIEDIAKELHKNGKSISSAISIAVSRVKVWAAGGGHVTAKTQAKAAAAVAAWEALKAKAKGKSTVKASHHNGEEYFFLSGIASFNVDSVRQAWNGKEQAARKAARANAGSTNINPEGVVYDDYYPYSYIKELWTDYLIVEVDSKEASLYKVNYSVADDGDVTFEDPIPVQVSYNEIPETTLDDDDMELLNDILSASAATPLERIIRLSNSK